MKPLFVFLFACTIFGQVQAQTNDSKRPSYVAGVQYNQEFILKGWVRVREWDMVGDKMRLKDLNVTTYPAVQINITRNFRKDGRSIGLSIDRYFMRGSTTFDRDIFYNGTIINGRNGIDVSPTKYYRFTLLYSDAVLSSERFAVNFLAGLVVDHIVFYLDGEVQPYSPKHEVFEGFGRQAFPYPVLGIRSENKISRSGLVRLNIFGTYIPRFKSFYTEGGNMDLEYSTLLADLKYTHHISGFDVSGGGKFRYMKLFQESREDTNELNTVTAGPYVELTYRF